MSRRTDAAFWDAAWSRPGHAGAEADEAVASEAFDTRRWQSFADAVLWDHVLPGVLPRQGTVLEVGSAPGRNLIRLHRRFGLDPWGIEFSPAGAELNRRRFAAAGLDPDHVLEVDFFDEAVLAEHAGSFDVVVSFGFVEHFDDPAAVVDRHLDLLRPGGWLVVTIPNLTGLNLALMRWLNPALIEAHNLDLMSPDAFRAAFDTRRVQPHWCGPYGSVLLSGFTTPGRLRRQALRGLRLLQRPLDLALRALGPDEAPDHPAIAPFLGFVGRKRDDRS